VGCWSDDQPDLDLDFHHPGVGPVWQLPHPLRDDRSPLDARCKTLCRHHSSIPSNPVLQQFYPECAQLNIINGGSLAPTSSELVKFPGGYSDNDPGLNINLYSNAAQTQTTYVIPGPPLYAGAASGGSSPAPSSSSATVTAKPTTSTVVSTTKPTSTSSSVSSGTGAAHYAQCGGSGLVFLSHSLLTSS
jgi:hypothetical protein